MLTNSKIALSVAFVLATASAAVADPNLNTTQIANDRLGPAELVYYQDLTTNGNQPHLRIDKLGAGDFIFVGSGSGANPAHSYEEKGLLISVERPPNATGGTHSSATVGQNITMPQRFLLIATLSSQRKYR